MGVKVSRVVIRSTLGGNCRLRTPNALTTTDAKLTEAIGENPNPFFFISPVTKPAFADYSMQPAPLQLRETSVVDFDTASGKTYILKSK